MITADQLTNAIDRSSGGVRFTVDLLARPERRPTDIQLLLSYSSEVWKTATTWNLRAPTGAAGLGWSLARAEIVRTPRHTASADGSQWTLSCGGAGTPLVRIGSDGALWTFAAVDYRFWKITYDPGRERWEIVLEDGTRQIFGDETSGRSTVQWGVAWDNWLGASALVAGQSQIAVRWSLSQVVDLWGNATTYSYDTDDVLVGPAGTDDSQRPRFTRSSRLVRIDGVGGESAVLIYQPKDPAEYQDPHTNPPPPNAWQDRYDTHYLQSVELRGVDDSLLFTQTLQYDDGSAGTAFLGSGDLTKRLLTGLRRTWASGRSLPAVRFAYYAASDGVSATTLYDATHRALYGALKSVTLAEGGQVTYGYGEQQLGLSQRSAAVSAPSQPNTTYSRPRFAIADEHLALAWYGAVSGGDPVLQLNAWRWSGRWLPATLDAIPVADTGAYDSTPILAQQGYVAVVSGQRVYVYHRDPNQPDTWVGARDGDHTWFTTTLTIGEPVSLVGGDRFVAVLGLTSGKLYRYRWTGSAWSDDGVQQLGQGATRFAAAADLDVLLTAAGSTTSGLPIALRVQRIDPLGAWTSSDFTVDPRTSSRSALSLAAGLGFATLTEQDVVAGNTITQLRALWWDRSYVRMDEADLGQRSYASGQTPKPAVLRGAMVSVGQQVYRFDGQRWLARNLGDIAFPAGATLVDTREGFDQVLRVFQNGSAVTTDLVAYDPNASSWAVPAGMSANATSTAVATRAARTRDTGADFVLLNGTLYRQQPDSSWSSVLVLPDTLTGDDLASLQLLDERYVVYQFGGDTKIFPLHDGGVAPGAPIVRSGEKSLISAGEPQALIGLRSFVTYTGTYGAADSRLTIYRVENQRITATQAGYGVRSVSVNNGYQVIAASLAYTVDNATVDATGVRPAFNKVTLVPGSDDPTSTPYGATELYLYNGLSAHENPARPYPSGSNAASYASRVVGSIYATRILNAGGLAGAAGEDTWTVTPVNLAANAQGLYIRLTQAAPALDGVTGLVRHTYSPDTGLVTETQRRNYDASGAEQAIIQRFEYFWEHYDPSRAMNLLAPVIRTTAVTRDVATNIDTITAIFVQTWKQDWGHGPGTWAPWQHFAARDASATFTRWSGGGESDANWLLVCSVLSRNATGATTSLADVLGTTTTQRFAQNGRWPTGGAVNAGPSEVDYVGFESYEDLAGWAWTDPASSLAANITDIDHHAGARCLELPPRPGQQIGPLRVFLPSNQARAYVFSAWVKTQSGFDPQSGAAKWQLAAHRSDNDDPVGAPMTIDIPDTGDAWRLVQQIIDLPGLRRAGSVPDTVSVYVVVQAWNQNSARYALVDDVRLSPVDGLFAAAVYDRSSGLLTATLGNNLETDRFVYDAASRRVAHVGPGERVKEVVALALSRELSPANGFLPSFPNSELVLRTTSDSAYYDFHDGKTSDWTFAGGTWTITGGALRYAPPSPAPTDPLGGTAILKLFAFTNFAVRVACTIDPAGNAGVGNGEMFVYWDGAQTEWVLARKASGGTLTTLARSDAVGFGEDWVFAVIEGFLIFAVNGVQVFAYTYVADTSVPDVGKPVLTLRQTGSFDDLLVLNDPQVGLGFLDGLGNRMQDVSYQGRGAGMPTYPTRAIGVLLDALGRPAFERDPLGPNLQLAPPGGTDGDASLVEGGQSTYLIDPQGNALTVPQYLAGQGGVYSYTTRRYEPSPLSRVVATVLPRATGAVEADFTSTFQYLATGDSGPAAVFNDLLPTGSSGRYFVRAATDPDGVHRYALIDQLGRLLARRTVMDDGSYHTDSSQYDLAGRLVTLNSPNVFTPPDGSQATDWKQTQTFDFLGRLTSRTTPSAGATKTRYDDAGRLRFLMTAEGAAQSPQQIRYARYDRLGRAVERGYIQDANYAWDSAALLAKLDDDAFPDVENSTSANYARGQWSRRASFDWNPGAPGILNLLGRPVQGRTWSSSPGVLTETLAYDANGNVTTHTSELAGIDAGAWVTGYQYNNLDQLAAITYPRQQGEDAVQVGYYFDRLGQLASVGDTLTGSEVIDPEHPADAGEKYYAAYTYDPRGAVSLEALNNGRGNPPGVVNPNSFTRSYSYTPQGWITALADPYLAQAVDYYGDPTHAYYNGNIASLAFRYDPERWPGAPADQSVTFAYDNLNRLRSADDDLNAAWSLGISAAGYDANGNLRALTRGATTTTYHYAADGHTPTSDRVDHLTSTASSSISFDRLTTSPPCASGWCWGADNDGPSNSAVVHDPERGDVLSLGGGSLGHTESLRLTTWLDPAGTYTLRYQLKTPADLASASGRAAWMLRIYTVAGEIVTTTIVTLAATGGAWSAQSHSVDLSAALSALGLGEAPSYVALECVNGLRAGSGSGAGPAVLLDDVSVTAAATVTAAAYGYDRDGNITAAPSRALTSLTYDPVTGITRDVTLSSGERVRYAYDAGGRRSLAQRLSAGAAVQSTTRIFTDLQGQLLMTVTTPASGTPVVTRYVQGPTGAIAMTRGDATHYLLKDHLGSTRALVDGNTGAVLGGIDYLPFGGTSRREGQLDIPVQYTGQRLDPDTGLYDYGARLYDPDLRRFYATDPTWGPGSPYAYVGNNPVVAVDPDGRDAIIKVDGPNRKITVSAEVVIYGAKADTPGLAQRWQNDILNQWNKNQNNGNRRFEYNSPTTAYDVEFDVTVRQNDVGWTDVLSPLVWSTGFNYVKVPSLGKGRSNVFMGYWGTWVSDPGDYGLYHKNVAAHEFGHMLGLKDRYVEGDPDNSWLDWFNYNIRRFLGVFADPRGYETNLMNEHWSGHVYQADIDAIVGPAVNAFEQGNVAQATTYLRPDSGARYFSSGAFTLMGGYFVYDLGPTVLAGARRAVGWAASGLLAGRRHLGRFGRPRYLRAGVGALLLFSLGSMLWLYRHQSDQDPG
ncbi:RHS repeat-associated core domain-containing protein [Sorangium sp. So ce128]|uniref:RHS repeat-associated core domain-containing protein n=1 Tax=Sorangium sp. So ce128 TaxID=3133281 RepID=UPI003F5DBD09